MNITKAPRLFILLTVALFLLMLIIENINGRFWLNDFKVMVSAAQAAINGEVIYGHPFGLDTGLYKYSPSTLFLFMPYTWLNYTAACVIHFILSVSLYIICTIKAITLVQEYFPKINGKMHLIYLLLLIIPIIHLSREFHLGNINVILVAALVYSYDFISKEKDGKAGFIFTLILFTKPYFIICLLPIIIYRRYRLFSSMIVSTVLLMLLNVIVFGYDKSIILHQEWLSAMKDHSSYLESQHTIFAITQTLTGIQLHANYLIGLIAAVAVISVFYIRSFKDKQSFYDNEFSNLNTMTYYFSLMAVLPNILITDTEHFLFSLPLLALTLFKLLKGSNLFFSVATSIALLLYSGMINEFANNFGYIGVGNLLLIIMNLIYTPERLLMKAEDTPATPN